MSHLPPSYVSSRRRIMDDPVVNYALNRRMGVLASMVGAAMATMQRHEGVLRGSEATKEQMAHQLYESIPDQLLQSGEETGTLWAFVTSAEGKTKVFLDQLAVQLTFTVFAKVVDAMEKMMTDNCKRRKVKDKPQSSLLGAFF